MLDIGEYITDGYYGQDGNGYDQLEGDWLTYYKVASKFVYKAQYQDRDDLLDNIILNLAVAGRSNGHKPDNASWMYRIASFTIAQYWRDYYYQTHGIDCGHCSNKQRKKCKANSLYSDCPRAIKIESLSKPIVDGDGQMTELGQLIADDRAIELDQWTDINNFLLSCPQKLIDIAEKIRAKERLTKTERQYLWRYRKEKQKLM